MPDDPTPKRPPGRPRKYSPKAMAKARELASDTLFRSERPRHLDSPRSQQDFIEEQFARYVIADWKRQGMPRVVGKAPAAVGVG